MRNSHTGSAGEMAAAIMIARIEQRVRLIRGRTLLVSTTDKENGKPTGRWRTDAFGAIAPICGLIFLFGLAAIVGGMP
jgi:hypothetical protein